MKELRFKKLVKAVQKKFEGKEGVSVEVDESWWSIKVTDISKDTSLYFHGDTSCGVIEDLQACILYNNTDNQFTNFWEEDGASVSKPKDILTEAMENWSKCETLITQLKELSTKTPIMGDLIEEDDFSCIIGDIFFDMN